MWHLCSRILVTGFLLLCPEDASRDFPCRRLYLEFVLPHPVQSRFNTLRLTHFGPLKNDLRRRRFAEEGELKHRVHEELRRVSKEFYTISLQRLTQRWEKCVDNEGDFVEKYFELCEVSKSMCFFGDLYCFTLHCCVINKFQVYKFSVLYVVWRRT